MKFMFQSLFKNIRETLNVPVREVKRSHLGFTLSLDLIGQHQNKRSQKSFGGSGGKTFQVERGKDCK